MSCAESSALLRGEPAVWVPGGDPSAAETPISDDQSVAGSPSDESGRPDEGPTGPDSAPAHEREPHG